MQACTIYAEMGEGGWERSEGLVKIRGELEGGERRGKRGEGVIKSISQFQVGERGRKRGEQFSRVYPFYFLHLWGVIWRGTEQNESKRKERRREGNRFVPVIVESEVGEGGREVKERFGQVGFNAKMGEKGREGGDVAQNEGGDLGWKVILCVPI